MYCFGLQYFMQLSAASLEKNDNFIIILFCDVDNY